MIGALVAATAPSLGELPSPRRPSPGVLASGPPVATLPAENPQPPASTMAIEAVAATPADGCRDDTKWRLSLRIGFSNANHDSDANTSATPILIGIQEMRSASMSKRPATAVAIVSAGRWSRYRPKHSLPA